jgi:hypothetical protein
VLGSGAAANRVSASIRGQVTGFDPGSLLDNLNDQISSLTIISTYNDSFSASAESFSASAFVLAANNLIEQSRLATASLLSVATR